MGRNSLHFCSMPPANNSIKYIEFSELDSTQRWAHAHPDAWNSEGWTAISAGSQTEGRGSGGTSWTDVPHSSLLLTLVSPPLDWSASYVFVRHAQASLVVAEWLQHQGFSVQLKWPNDLYLDGQKLGGILTEAYWQQQVCTRWFLGLGINVSSAPEGCAHLPGLRLEGLVAEVSERLADALSGPVASDTLDRYSAQLLGWRQRGPFEDLATGTVFWATPRFISPDGRLGIQLDSGTVRWVDRKELRWLISR